MFPSGNYFDSSVILSRKDSRLGIMFDPRYRSPHRIVFHSARYLAILAIREALNKTPVSRVFYKQKAKSCKPDKKFANGELREVFEFARMTRTG